MDAAVDRLYDEVDDVTGVVVASAKKTFFAGGNLKLMVAGDPGRRRRGLRDVRGDQGRPAPARDCSRARSSPRSTAPRSAAASRSPGLPTTGSSSTTRKVELGLPEATLGLLPGGGGVTRVVRMLGIQSGADGRAAARAPASSRPRRRRRAWSTRSSPPARSCVPAAKAWIKANRDDATPREPVGPRRATRCPAARRSRPQAGGVPAGVPGAAAQADQGRGLPRPAGDPVGRGRGRAGRLRHRARGSSRAT